QVLYHNALDLAVPSCLQEGFYAGPVKVLPAVSIVAKFFNPSMGKIRRITNIGRQQVALVGDALRLHLAMKQVVILKGKANIDRHGTDHHAPDTPSRKSATLRNSSW